MNFQGLKVSVESYLNDFCKLVPETLQKCPCLSKSSLGIKFSNSDFTTRLKMVEKP